MLDQIKYEILQELGVPLDEIYAGVHAELPSRICGELGARVREIYKVVSQIEKEKQEKRD